MRPKYLSIVVVFLVFSFNILAQEDGNNNVHFDGRFDEINITKSVAATLPFFDDFGETLIDDSIFQNWTTENLEGWNYWHIIPWGGPDGSQCMRFEISEITQNDWLISKPIDCSYVDRLAINFDINYSGAGPLPRLLYSTNYNGYSDQSDWTEINYSLGPNKNEWHSVDEVVIENPGEVIYFAFQYQSDPQNAVFYLLDNFSVKEYISPPDYELIGDSEYVQFFARSEDSYYWDAISDDIDDWVRELCSFWDRPGRTSLLDGVDAIKIYLTDRDEVIRNVGTSFPDWKFGGYKMPDQLYLSLPPGGINDIYEGSFSKLTKNVLSQLLLNKKHAVNGTPIVPDNYLEAFALYYTGYRPDRDLVIDAINDLGRYPTLSDIDNIDDFSDTYKKDLLVSYIEAQVLTLRGFQSVDYHGDETIWQHHFQYFYENPEDDRIMLRKQTLSFNIYSTAQDLQYLDQISDKLEEKLAHYSKLYEFPIYHRFNVVIYPSAEAAIYSLVILDGYNGGSGWSGEKMDILSPLYFGGGINEALLSLVPHEFFHVFHFNMVTHLFDIPGFHSEGMAEIMAYEGQNDEYLSNRWWYFKEGLERFQNENGREPTLEDIMPDSDGYMSVYSYGQAFWHYMQTTIADYPTIKQFFINDCDWSVFDVPYEEINAGYIDYLKVLARLAFTIPTVRSRNVSLVTPNSVSLQALVASDGNFEISRRGFYWSISNSSPTTDDNVEIVTGTTGEYSFELTGLSQETTYYYRAFATNSEGTALGEVQSFSLDDFKSTGDVDGDHEIDLNDAITTLQILTNTPVTNINLSADVNQDGKIGIEEAIYVLRSL